MGVKLLPPALWTAAFLLSAGMVSAQAWRAALPVLRIAGPVLLPVPATTTAYVILVRTVVVVPTTVQALSVVKSRIGTVVVEPQPSLYFVMPPCVEVTAALFPYRFAAMAISIPARSVMTATRWMVMAAVPPAR